MASSGFATFRYNPLQKPLAVVALSANPPSIALSATLKLLDLIPILAPRRVVHPDFFMVCHPVIN